MKIFLDTNILLDLLLDRQYVQEAIIILNAIERGVYEGFILDISLVNIAYVSRKQGVDASDFLALLIKNCKIVGADNLLSSEALGLKHNDYEDALQYTCAKGSGCEYIVTNDKKFYVGEVHPISSVKFINNYMSREND